jgi:flagellar biosynthesis protein FliR
MGMNIVVDMGFIATAWLIFIRLSALFLLTPLFAAGQLPVRVRILWLLPLAAVLAAVPTVMPAGELHSIGHFIQASACELLVGALMAFGLYAAFGAFLFGGRILDFQMGFGVANLIDPSSNEQAPLIGTMLNLLAVAVFFLLDGHHWLLRGIVYSLEQVPPGTGVGELNMPAILAQFGLMFVYGLMLVAPVIFVLLLLDVGMAVAARTMPQVNMFIVGLPLKIFVGLTVLAISLNFTGPLFQKVFRSVFEYWEGILV